ncbi:hypothetical protein EQG49_09300 [Periweissella cryptocerci]|uniref:Lipoprotein n=1 Tax=Periweissella cryptocerci TaxID=2506420 RepID=A0A4P6YV45_9LACO|nr:hypothetical protein [Periweissella cryptocerci]QBO36652.1 hypothetical protein EQG49_09300 [Periweissella cryptocerci]
MKKVFATIGVLALLAVVVSGCGLFSKDSKGNDAYASAISAGKQAVNDGEYKSAQREFQTALDKKKNDYAAQTYLAQTKAFVAGQKAMKAKDFDTATQYFQQVTGANKGLDTLIQRANNEISSIKDKQAASSSSAAIAQSSSAASSSSESATSSSVATSTVTSSSSSAKKDENEGVGSDKSGNDTKDSMGNKITNSEIKQARATLNKAGIQAGAFSDSDIKGFIKQASDPTSGGLVQVVQDFINTGK